jgi:predicted extracellular nuclease
MKARSIALALLVASACGRGGNGNTPDAPGGGPDSPSSDDTSIYDIQDPSVPLKVPDGAMVNIRGVVITAIDMYGSKTGTFWIEEPAGGAYSGVMVYGAAANDVVNLQVGDLVDVTGGQKKEFALAADTSGRTTTEIEKPTGGAIMVAKVGTGTVPPPMVVDALAIGRMATQAERDAEWEKWEGVLISVSNLGVISSTKTFGATPGVDSEEFTVTGPLVVESTLAAFPGTTGTPPGPQFGDCEMNITGIGDYFFDWLLEPRATSEITTGGTSCPAAETGIAACTDGVDNDANGHADCFDYSCMLDAAAGAMCTKAATVHDIDTSATNAAVGTSVTLANVCLVAIDAAKQNLWVQDAAGAAVDTGLYVFRGSKSAALALTVGTTVNISTSVILPYHGLMELTGIPGATTASPNVVDAGDNCTPVALSVPIATLADTTMIKHYAGSLVKVSATKLTVTAVTGTGTTKRYTLSDGTTNIEVGTQIYDINATAGATCFSAMTAVATVDTSPNPSVPELQPRSAADLVTTACN